VKVFSKIYTALIFTFLYAPILILIVFSFNQSKTRGLWTGFTLKWYEELFRDKDMMSALSVTLIVAVVASTVAVVIGTLAAVGVFSMKKRARSLIMAVNQIPMVNPEIVTGISLMLLFVLVYNSIGLFETGIGTLLIAHISFCIPYVMLSVLPKLRQMNYSVYEAALDLGCSPVKAFFKVVLPEIFPGIMTGFLMAFTLSLDDFVISLFTGGSAQTLSVLIYSMTKKRVSPTINALSTLLFVSVLILLILANLGQIRSIKRANQKARAEKGQGEMNH
jgi:spermidine/putrescine transport system permease protein